MINWWNGLSFLGQIFAVIGISATTVLVIQSVLLLFGIGFSDGDMDTEVGSDFNGDAGDVSDLGNVSDGLSLFTIRGIVAFFSIGGFSGLLMTSAEAHPAVSILVSLAAGTVALFVIAIIFKFAFKLQGNGNLDINNAIGKCGKVYIPIPENKKGFGKISILIQETLVELSAVTNDDSSLKTGELVTVLSSVDAQTVLVTSASQEQINNKSLGGISKWIQ